MTILVILLTAVILLLTVLVAGLLRSHAEVLRALHELGVSLDPDDPAEGAGAQSMIDLRTRPGVAAPRATVGGPSDVVGRTPNGGLAKVSVTGPSTGGDRLTLLAFLSSGCLTCAGFWEAFADPVRRTIDGLDAELVIVSKGPDLESEASVLALAPNGVRTVMSSDAWLDYEVPVSPYFILVERGGPDGGSARIVGEGAASTWEQVANLLKQAVADAGIARRRESGTRRTGRNGAQREADTDAELRRAGIEPGDPSLYPSDPQGPGQ